MRALTLHFHSHEYPRVNMYSGLYVDSEAGQLQCQQVLWSICDLLRRHWALWWHWFCFQNRHKTLIQLWFIWKWFTVEWFTFLGIMWFCYEQMVWALQNRKCTTHTGGCCVVQLVHIYIHTVCMYIHTHIYNVCVCVYVYIYIHIYIYCLLNV